MTEELENKHSNIIKDNINKIFLSAFRSNSERLLNKKIESFERNNIFNDEDLSKHFAHQEINEIAYQNVLKGFIIDRLNFIINEFGEEKINTETFIDIGDPDGIFIKGLKKTEYSANISEIGVQNIHKKGIEAIRCDAENIPLKDNSIDNILFFEIFEHLPNPIEALKELSRVCNKTLILSIPHMSKTNIHQYNYRPDWFLYEHHIFEFSPEDFERIVSHSSFKIKKMKTVTVIGNGTIIEKFVFLLWDLYKTIRPESEYVNNGKDLYYGCFKKFDIYILCKD